MEDLEQLSTLTLAAASDSMCPMESPEKRIIRLSPPRIYKRRLQYKALYQKTYEPKLVRTHSSCLSDQLDPLRTSDGRSKAIFSLSKPSDAVSLQTAISLYRKFCSSHAVLDYAAQEKLKNPDARCIYVPRKIRPVLGSVEKGRKICDMTVKSRTILPPLRGKKVKD